MFSCLHIAVNAVRMVLCTLYWYTFTTACVFSASFSACFVCNAAPMDVMVCWGVVSDAVALSIRFCSFSADGCNSITWVASLVVWALQVGSSIAILTGAYWLLACKQGLGEATICGGVPRHIFYFSGGWAIVTNFNSRYALVTNFL